MDFERKLLTMDVRGKRSEKMLKLNDFHVTFGAEMARPSREVSHQSSMRAQRSNELTK